MKSWQALDESLADVMGKRAPGVVDSFCTWWAVEAERCRLVGDHKAELQAFRESLKLAEQFATILYQLSMPTTQ